MSSERVTAVIAVIAGVRAGICMIPLPSRMRRVAAPYQASMETTSLP